jgi:hypothetical protein
MAAMSSLEIFGGETKGMSTQNALLCILGMIQQVEPI